MIVGESRYSVADSDSVISLINIADTWLTDLSEASNDSNFEFSAPSNDTFYGGGWGLAKKRVAWNLFSSNFTRYNC